MIKIVGLGPGSPDALTIGAVRALEESKNLYFRTEKHPTVDYLKKGLTSFKTCDNYYEEGSSFDEVYSNDDLDKVLPLCDFVVIVTPLTDATRHMFNMDKFRIMKKTAVVINIARGPVVKEDDLIRALQTGEIGGAALDAVEEEPLSSDSPLWDMDNVIITPHCAADSKLYIDRAIALFCENLKLYEEGKTLLNEIDMKQRY